MLRSYKSSRISLVLIFLKFKTLSHVYYIPFLIFSLHQRTSVIIYIILLIFSLNAVFISLFFIATHFFQCNFIYGYAKFVVVAIVICSNQDSIAEFGHCATNTTTNSVTLRMSVLSLYTRILDTGPTL